MEGWLFHIRVVSLGVWFWFLMSSSRCIILLDVFFHAIWNLDFVQLHTGVHFVYFVVMYCQPHNGMPGL